MFPFAATIVFSVFIASLLISYFAKYKTYTTGAALSVVGILCLGVWLQLIIYLTKYTTETIYIYVMAFSLGFTFILNGFNYAVLIFYYRLDYSYQIWLA